LKGDPADSQAKLLLGLVSEKSGDDATAVTMLESGGLVRTQPEAAVARAKSYHRTGEHCWGGRFFERTGKWSTEGHKGVARAQVACDMQE
jgi:hypothetical protein